MLCPRNRLERAQRLDRGRAQTFVACHRMRRTGRFPFLVDHRRGDRRHFARVVARVPSGDRALLAAQSECVGVLSRDLVFLGDHRRAHELARRLIVGRIARAHRYAAFHVRTERHARHHLDAAAHHDVFETGADHRRAERRRLLARSALRIDSSGSDFQRQSGRQPSDARDVERLLADLRNAAADHLADLFAVEAAALQSSELYGAEQVRRHQSGQTLAAFADGATDRFDNVDVLHTLALQQAD